ncbi:MAG: molybdopterin-binding oxidoreductase [Dehalococcoidia bacterium]|nr:molybdopterin-binding oxidoreductase [Dehalococcoidia bacterium]
METGQQATTSPGRVSRAAGLAIGLVSGLVITTFVVALRFALNAPVYLEIMADGLTRATPPSVFDFVLTHLQVSAKPLMFGGLLAGQVLAGGGLGMLYVRYSAKLPFSERQPWHRGLLIGSSLWLPLMVVVTPIAGGGAFGSSLPNGPWRYLFTSFLALTAYGLSLAQLHSLALARKEGRQDMGRRRLLKMAAIVAILAAVGGLAVRAIARGASQVSPSRVFGNAGMLPPEITPNDQFYEVSKNIINPRVDATTWKLEITGNLGNAYSLSYDELKALPWQEQYVTLTCISNNIGGDLVSNALWQGVPLKLVLERAKLLPATARLAFFAADGYVDSFPVERAMQENVLVAYLMNGEPLSDAHGFPARLIVPGLYGMENVKWLARIEPVPANFRGYWQQRGWADTAVINTMSRVDVPSYGAVVAPQETLVGGVAFAGDRGVTRVEVSTDGGVSWHPAEVRKALSPYTWVLWTRAWTPPSAGPYTITVRATDGAGQTQTMVVQDSLPDGATGYHSVVVSVQEA